MEDVHFKLKILLALTIGFAFAGILGLLTQRIKLSPILGYLLAGYIIGPYFPYFFNTDVQLSEQLAEIGVVLMMFGVGMHFKWQDLVKVKNIAVTGAIGQTLFATGFGTLLVYLNGYSIETGIIIGLAISVASTVVLVRVLGDNELLSTSQGHVAIGWLIVEDLLTIAALVLIPLYAQTLTGEGLTWSTVGSSIAIILLKIFLLILFMFTVGRKIVTYILNVVARTRSHEILTLWVLALTFIIATTSSLLFGTSIALGAFIAGMVIAQSDVKYQALANSLPIRDAFVVLFFISIGMLFNPYAIYEHFSLFLSVLGVILIVKPLAAYLIVKLLNQPFVTAMTVGLGLAQIGEFSFILTEESMKFKILPDEGYDIIVACALVTIAINPILFRLFKRYLYVAPIHPEDDSNQFLPPFYRKHRSLVIGHGPIGQEVSSLLEGQNFDCVIVERNIDTVRALQEEGRPSIFGDFTNPNIMSAAKIETTDLLVITAPDLHTNLRIVKMAQEYNPNMVIVARANFLTDKVILQDLGVDCVCSEEETRNKFHEEVKNIIGLYFGEKKKATT